ncbi:MAG: hypothetical protein MJK15_00690 [Colwellia sp.]|nr:hypothetical protein [Colwellia sp.]
MPLIVKQLTAVTVGDKLDSASAITDSKSSNVFHCKHTHNVVAKHFSKDHTYFIEHLKSGDIKVVTLPATQYRIYDERTDEDKLIETMYYDARRLAFSEPVETQSIIKAAIKDLVKAGYRKESSCTAEALANLLKMYVDGVNCGDWGNWDPEEEAEVIAARKALEATNAKPTQS